MRRVKTGHPRGGESDSSASGIRFCWRRWVPCWWAPRCRGERGGRSRLIGGGYGKRPAGTGICRCCNRRVGCGFITWSLRRTASHARCSARPRPDALMLSFGDPRPFAKRMQAETVVLTCQEQSREHALQARDAGAEIIVAWGTEGWRPRWLSRHAAIGSDHRGSGGAARPRCDGGGRRRHRRRAWACSRLTLVLVGTRFYASIE
jgi:nitronate monooxygenase